MSWMPVTPAPNLTSSQNPTSCEFLSTTASVRRSSPGWTDQWSSLVSRLNLRTGWDLWFHLHPQVLEQSKCPRFRKGKSVKCSGPGPLPGWHLSLRHHRHCLHHEENGHVTGWGVQVRSWKTLHIYTTPDPSCTWRTKVLCYSSQTSWGSSLNGHL